MTIAILKNARLSYPDLWTAGKPMNDGDTPKFGGQFIFGPDSEAATVAKKALVASAQEVFGANWQAILNAMEKTKKCVRKGDDNLTKDGAIRDGYGGNLYLVARNKVKPLIIGPTRVKPAGTNGMFDGIEVLGAVFDKVQVSDGWPVLEERMGKPYGGCYVNVKVDIKAMKAFEKVPNQVYATLLTVQYAGKGEAFGAAPGTSEGFDEVAGETAGAGDDPMGDIAF